MRAWNAAVVVAALVVCTAAGFVVTSQHPVAQAGEALGYVPPTPAVISTPAPTRPLVVPDVKGRSLEVSIVGDSLTVGTFATGPTTRNRDLILAALRRRGPVTAVEAAHTGGSTASTAVTVPGRLDLVVLELGTAEAGSVSAGNFVVSYVALVSEIRKTSPTAALVCAGTWSAGDVLFDAIIQQACVAAGGRYVGLRDLYAKAANRGPAKVTGFYGLSDDVAPNNAGHRAIASAILAAIGLHL